MKFTAEDLNNMADEVIKQMEQKLNESKDKNKDWGKTINIVFRDIDTGYAMKFAMDGSIEKIDKKPISELKLDEDSVTNAIGNVEDIKKCVDGYFSPMDAYASGMLKVEGNFNALQRLMPCFPETGLSL